MPSPGHRKLTIYQVIEPSVPSADQFRAGLQTGALDCNTTASPVTKTIAKDTLLRFCTDHLGVNIAQGNNFSTYYDAKDTRLYFNVINQCAPNGVYLPYETCISGFTRVAECTAECGQEFTAGGQTTEDCIIFELSASSDMATLVGDHSDGVVVTCEGALCG